MPEMLAIGHRGRGPLLDTSDIDRLQGAILAATQYGKAWYVNSAATAGGNGASPGGAYTTLAGALAYAQSGDRIYVAAGHAETISAAGGITWSQSGVTVIGLGVGAVRPTFTFSATASTFVISGANNILSNVRVKSSIDEVVSMFTVSGDGNTLDRVDFVETTSAQTIQFAVVTGDDCTIQNCVHHQVTAAAAAQRWIALTGADRFRFVGNTFVLTLSDNATSCAVGFVTTQCIGVFFAYNHIYQLGYSAAMVSAFISTSGTTGIVAHCGLFANVAANTTINDMPGCASFQVLATNAVDKNGILDPIADT